MKPFITSFATGASIIGLAFIKEFPVWVRIILAVVGIVGAIILLVDDLKNNKVNELVCQSNAEIKSAMKALIKVQGKVCIMSRDLSWVDSEVEACIVAKSKSMLIFAQSPTEITKRLCERGVNIMYYGHLKFEPKSRFTVIRYGRYDSQVAIANTKSSIRKPFKFQHKIYETEDNNCLQDISIKTLAEDMIELCKVVCKEEDK